jgi:GTP-binding protein
MLSHAFCQALTTREIPLRLEFVQSGAKLSDLPTTEGYEIALVGRSNVGKSSLLNFLAGQRQLARVSSTPGRTQLINMFTAEKEAFSLIDLPGYGFAFSPREIQAHWGKELARYFQGRRSLVGVLFLVDARRDVVQEDAELCRWFLSLGLRVLAVQTKCDKIHKSQWSAVRARQAQALGLAPGAIVSTSAEKKIGLRDLFAGLSGLLTAALVDDEPDDPDGSGDAGDAPTRSS